MTKETEFRTETERSTDGKGFSETMTMTHRGREFTAGSGFFHPDASVAIGYLSKDEASITMGAGERMDSARIVAMWKTPASYISSEMFQVEANIDGIIFTGRCAGSGMLWKGKRKAKQTMRSPSPSAFSWERTKAERAKRARERMEALERERAAIV